MFLYQRVTSCVENYVLNMMNSWRFWCHETTTVWCSQFCLSCTPPWHLCAFDISGNLWTNVVVYDKDTCDRDKDKCGWIWSMKILLLILEFLSINGRRISAFFEVAGLTLRILLGRNSPLRSRILPNSTPRPTWCLISQLLTKHQLQRINVDHYKEIINKSTDK